MSKAVSLLGAAFMKRLLYSSQSLECIMVLLNSIDNILTKRTSEILNSSSAM